MKKVFILFLVIFCVVFTEYAEKLADLPEVLKEPRIFVSDNGIFMVEFDEATIHKYSMKDFSHVLKFGRKGEGPGEFKWGPSIIFQKDNLITVSSDKLSFFTYEGKLIKEKKTPRWIRVRHLIGDNYVANRSIVPQEIRGMTEIKSKIVILDDQFQEKKEIYTLKRSGMVFSGRGGKKRDMEFLRYYENFDLCGDKIVIGNSKKGFYFDLRSLEGETVNEINLPYDKREVTEKDKKRLIAERKERLERGAFPISWEEYIKRFKGMAFPDYFPAYARFHVFDGYIYVISHEREGKRWLWHKMDAKGNILKKIFLPSDNPYYVFQDVFYYVVENEEEEMYELHMIKI
jgi:hypothetical protein